MAGAWSSGAARLLLAAAAFALTACAQPRDQVAVGVGTAAYVRQQARPYAVLYKPYAQMSVLAYTNTDFLTPSSCPDLSKLQAGGTEQSAANAAMLVALNRAGWSCRRIGTAGRRSSCWRRCRPAKGIRSRSCSTGSRRGSTRRSPSRTWRGRRT